MLFVRLYIVFALSDLRLFAVPAPPNAEVTNIQGKEIDDTRLQPELIRAFKVSLDLAYCTWVLIKMMRVYSKTDPVRAISLPERLLIDRL